MANYEIPKEIKSKPKLMGLEMRELIIVLIGFFSIFTILKDTVHSAFSIPFMIIASGILFWAVMPSKNNPNLRNYMSLIIFFKRNKQTYHALDHYEIENKLLSEQQNQSGKGDGL